MSETQAPTRVVLPREMFFSLTDERGLITGANEVFSRIARLQRGELIGAPHSVVRNAAVPGGVFRLLWDVVKAGRPFAGYVLNLAQDGANYWVYATVTPIPGGYLSVRTAPCLTDVWVVAGALYEQVLAREQELRAAGMNRRLAAEIGRDLILEGLAGLGFASYEDFMLATLPGEVTERAARARDSLSEAALDDPDLESIRQLGTLIGEETGTLLTQLAHFQELSENLREASAEAFAAADGLMTASGAAREASAVVAGAAPAVYSTAQAMENGGRRTLAGLKDLGAQLNRDQKLLRGLQIRIAIAKLHADMVVQFVHEAALERNAETAIMHMPEICRALQGTVGMLANALGAHSVGMRSAVETIDSISSGLSEFQSFLFMWRSLLIRHGVSGAVSQHLTPIDRQLSAGSIQITRMRVLADRCIDETRPYDSQTIVARVRRLAEYGERIQTGARCSTTRSNAR